MSLLIPLTTERVALAFNEWCDVHASNGKPFDVADALHDAGELVAVRTVCGSDVHPYIVTADLPTGPKPMLMSWPPPPRMRCQDCQRITGAPTRQTSSVNWAQWGALQ